MERELKPSIRKTYFLSRLIRYNVANGQIGRDILKKILPINLPGPLVRSIQDIGKLEQKKNSGGSLDWVFNGIKAIGFGIGWTLNKIGFSATLIFSIFFNRSSQLWTFNWNASDKSLMKLIEGSRVTLAAVWGSFIGQGLGWLAGIAIGSGISLILPVIGGAALARYIATRTAIEAKEELLPGLYGAIQTTLGVSLNNMLILQYIGIRKVIKQLPKSVLETVLGKEGATTIKDKWGADNGPAFRMSEKVEEKIESISDPALKVFIENILEESWDSFIEAGFIVANQIDDAYSQAKQASVQALGTERSAELTLNKQSSKVNQETIKLQKLPQKQMITLVQQQISNYKVMQNRDVGMLMGMPLDEYAKAKEQTLRIVIDLYSRKEPPFYRDTENLVKATIAISDVKRAMLDWEKIKLACGGENGYMWGRFKAAASLDNGRKLYIYAATEQEAQSQIEQFLRLSSADMLTLNITEEKKVAQRAKKPKLSKDPTRIYPAYFTVINRKEIIDPTKGRATTKQNYRDARIRIPLWTKEAPANYKELIQDILTQGF